MARSSTRTRRLHTRSRTGCQPCKKKHVRCDETRPICKNCILTSAKCEYLTQPVELWTSAPKTAGQHGVFSVWQISRWPTAATDPFNSLPGGMPLRSQQLFAYFLNAHTTDCSTPLSKASLAGALQNRSLFRSLLLLAGLHYSWNTGDLREYETTYLVHRIECLRSINDFIKNPKGNRRELQAQIGTIATLCLTDASTGNVTAAETHLNGLTSMLANSDALRTLGLSLSEEAKAEDAILQRYILVCIMEVARIKFPESNFEINKAGGVSFGAVMPLHKLQDRLSGFWMIPYFLAVDDLTSAEVDGAQHLNNLRFLTATYDECRPSSLPTGLENAATEGWGTSAEGIMSYFMQGVAKKNSNGPTTTFVSDLSSSTSSTTRFTETKTTASSSGDSQEGGISFVAGDRYAMSWMTLTITSGFYLYAVLNLGTSNAGLPLGGAPILWVIWTVQREVDTAFKHLTDEQNSTRTYICKGSPELWLWTLFMGAITVAGLHHMAAATGTIDTSLPGGEATFQELEGWFALKMRIWSEHIGVTDWEGDGGARDYLAAVVWPMNTIVEPLAKAIWEGALAK